MLVIAICTEGDNSEPAYIRALKTVFSGSVAQLDNVGLQIVPVPLGGNAGHKKIFEKADEAIEYAKYHPDPLNPDILSLVDENEDKIEKWIICDYDKMHKDCVDIGWLRDAAEKTGYRLVVNRPKFDFFVLLHFIGFAEAIKIKVADYDTKLQELVKKYNECRGFTDASRQALKLPKYSKKKHIAYDFFCKLLDRGLVDEISEIPCDVSASNYSEMP